VLLALPLDAAVRVILWAHLLWAAAGTYLYLRRVLQVGPVAAWTGAASFALSTWLPGLAGMPVVLTTLAWLPWVLLAGQLAAARGGRWMVLLGIAAALQLVAGWPAGAYLTWAALIPLAVLAPVDGGGGSPGARVDRTLIRLAFGAALAALLAAVLLVPAVEFVGQTNYAQTRPLSRLAREGYLTLLSWFRPASGTGSLESSQLYPGTAALALALAGLVYGPRRPAIAFGALALLAIVIAAGTHGPLFALLYRWLPGFRIVYLPARLGAIATFALACLAALGLERVRAGPWRGRQAATLALLAITAAPAIAGQFWLSEGYDDFRRLLTNVGRFTGGPFLSREQEAWYALAGALALLLLALASRWRPATGVLVALVALDLAGTQWHAAPPGFDPLDWYGRALQGAAPAAAQAGEARVAGLQWHGQEHFLDDFPASADPALLPPNLALLAGVRDAQGYNPLLLRRAVDYFAAINGQSDDHWLWITRFRSPLVDALGVRWVAAAGESAWRVTDTLLAQGASLPRGGTSQVVWQGVPVAAGGLDLVSYLGEATQVPQGAPAIEVRVHLAGGDEARLVLRAGEETAEWAYDRPDVRAAIQHRQAPVALATRLTSAVGGSYHVYAYLARLPLPAGSAITTIEARSLLPGVAAYLQEVWVRPPPGGEDDAQTEAMAGGLLRRGAQPRARVATTVTDARGEAQTSAPVAGAGARIVVDQPERVRVEVASPVEATLVLADAYYPGWMATVDGAAATIVPVDGLFRGVAIPAGRHTVELAYRPQSLRVGLAGSAAGIIALLLLLGAPARRRAAGPR